jgi:quercetin dioxygenase-like cupin family protein
MKTLVKVVYATVALMLVAYASYAVGVAQGKAVNVPASAMKWAPYAPGNPLQVAALWGDRTKGDYGMLLKMPAGFEAGRHSHTGDYHALAIQGTWVHTNEGGKPVDLAPGSYVLQPGKQVHNDSCKGSTDCIILVHQHAAGDFIPAKP